MWAQEKPAEGKVSLMIQPFGAEIRVDGELLGKSPLESLPLPAGEHELRIRYEGYQEFSTRIKVEAGKSIMVRGHLQSINSTESPQPALVISVQIPSTLRMASQKRVYRLGALALSGAALLSAGILYSLGSRAGDDYSRAVDNYTGIKSACEAAGSCSGNPDLDKYKNQANGARTDFNHYRDGYYTSLAVTGLFAGIAACLYIIQRSQSSPSRSVGLTPFPQTGSTGEIEGMGISTNIRF